MQKIFTLTISLLVFIPFISCRVTSRVSEAVPYFSGVSEEYIFSAGPNEFKTIEIKLPPNEVNKIQAFFSQEFQLKIITEFWGESRDQLREFINQSLKSKTNTDQSYIYIDLNGSFGSRAVTKGSYSVSGVYLNTLKIAIPGNCETHIIVNGVPLDSLIAVQKPAEPAHEEKSVLSDERVERLSEKLGKLNSDDSRYYFLRFFLERKSNLSSERFITMGQVVSILRSFSSDFYRYEACKLFSGHIIDDEFSDDAIDSFNFSNYAVECYKFLSK